MGGGPGGAEGLIASMGDIAKFGGRVRRGLRRARLRFFGEALRQCGVPVSGSAIVIWTLAFILGLQCGLEGAYFNRLVGAPAYARVFSAWCDLREVIPYAWRLHARRQGRHRARRRARRDADHRRDRRARGDGHLLAHLPLRDALWPPSSSSRSCTRPPSALAASYLAVVQQIGEVSSGGFFLIFWMFQNPPDLLYSLIKAMAMATVTVIVGTYYGYTAWAGRSASAPRPPSRWCSTRCSCT